MINMRARAVWRLLANVTFSTYPFKRLGARMRCGARPNDRANEDEENDECKFTHGSPLKK